VFDKGQDDGSVLPILLLILLVLLILISVAAVGGYLYLKRSNGNKDPRKNPEEKLSREKNTDDGAIMTSQSDLVDDSMVSERFQ
jgi:flagellar basal body-associated protein FliL